SARSMSAARRVASPEAESPLADLATSLAVVAAATLADDAGRADGDALAFDAGFALGRLGEDIHLIPFLDDLVAAQSQLAVGDTFAGLHVVFVAVPEAAEMHLGVGEIESFGRLVRAQPLFDLGNGQAFAGRAALMQAVIRVGVEFALVFEHPDFIVADKDDAAIAVLELRELTDELFSHT